MVHKVEPRRRGWPSIPLIGLAEASSLSILRRLGMSMQTAAKAVDFIRAEFNDEYAMASPHLVTDGIDAFVHFAKTDDVVRIKDRQQAIVEVVRDHLRPIVVGADSYVEAYEVNRAGVSMFIDPRFSAGRLTFANRTPVFAVLGALKSGEEPIRVALDFGLPPTHVEAIGGDLEWLAQVA